MSDVLIKSVKIVDKNSPHYGDVKDVLVTGDKITRIGDIDSKAYRVIEAAGMVLSSGWCDLRAWLGDPGFEYKEDLTSGRAAAEAGGFTHVVVLPNNRPATQSKNDIAYLEKGNASELVQLHPMACASVNAEGHELTEMIDLHHAGAVAFTDGLQSIWHTDILLKAIQYVRKFDGLVVNKPEDKFLNAYGVMNEGVNSTILGLKGMPNIAEDIIVERDLRLLEYAGGRLHFSCISSANAISMIRVAKKRGLNVTCDMASYQPLLDDGLISNFDTLYKVNPPLRTDVDNKALLEALKDGTIDVMVSNHMPHDEECKKLEYNRADFGMINLQTVASHIVALSRHVPLEDLIDKISITPKKILKIPYEPIAEGALADLTLFDPHQVWIFNKNTNRSKSRNSPYFDTKLKGRAVALFHNGKYHLNDL